MSRVYKFRLRIGSKIVGYEKWYEGSGTRAKAVQLQESILDKEEHHSLFVEKE